MRRIGVLMSDLETDPDGQARVTTFLRDVQELGWVDGRNIRIDTRWSGGDATAHRDERAAAPRFAARSLAASLSAFVSALN